MGLLNGKVAVITGAGSGMAKASAGVRPLPWSCRSHREISSDPVWCGNSSVPALPNNSAEGTLKLESVGF